MVKIKKKYTRNPKQISHVSSMSSFGIDPSEMDERRPGSQVPVTPWLQQREPEYVTLYERIRQNAN